MYHAGGKVLSGWIYAFDIMLAILLRNSIKCQLNKRQMQVIELLTADVRYMFIF